MAKNETCEEREARRLRSRLSKMTNDPEFVAVNNQILNDYKSQAQQRIEEARRKCAERREKREKAKAVVNLI